MQKIILGLFATASLAGCTSSDYGKKVTIEGSKGEVYYKGDGVTEADAKKLGEYLTTIVHYFKAENPSSVQLTKAKDEGYDIRLAVDENKLNDFTQANEVYAKNLGALLSIDLYDNKPVNIFITDIHFKESKSIPFDPEEVKKVQEKRNPADITEPVADTTGNNNQ